MMQAVPISGSSSVTTAIMKIMPSCLLNKLGLRPRLTQAARYAEISMMETSFANSAGWKLAGPRGSHRLAPLISTPMISTATRAMNIKTIMPGIKGRQL